MRDHYLEVRRGFGERQVIALDQMAKDWRLRTATLAHVVLKLQREGCHTGATEVRP